MYRLQSGDLRERVDIQSYTETQSSTGVITRSWATDDTRWCSIRVLSLVERIRHKQQEASGVYEVILRYYDDLTVDQRLVINSRTFEIRSVDNTDRKRHVTKAIVTEEIL